jgi:hypothetical protein
MHAAKTRLAAGAPSRDFHGAYSTLKQPYHLLKVCRELFMSDFPFAVPVFEYYELSPKQGLCAAFTTNGA